jgi:hypothetical protein
MRLSISFSLGTIRDRQESLDRRAGKLFNCLPSVISWHTTTPARREDYEASISALEWGGPLVMAGLPFQDERTHAWRDVPAPERLPLGMTVVSSQEMVGMICEDHPVFGYPLLLTEADEGAKIRLPPSPADVPTG